MNDDFTLTVLQESFKAKTWIKVEAILSALWITTSLVAFALAISIPSLANINHPQVVLDVCFFLGLLVAYFLCRLLCRSEIWFPATLFVHQIMCGGWTIGFSLLALVDYSMSVKHLERIPTIAILVTTAILMLALQLVVRSGLQQMPVRGAVVKKLEETGKMKLVYLSLWLTMGMTMLVVIAGGLLLG